MTRVNPSVPPDELHRYRLGKAKPRSGSWRQARATGAEIVQRPGFLWSAPDFCGALRISVERSGFLWSAPDFCGAPRISVERPGFLWSVSGNCGASPETVERLRKTGKLRGRTAEGTRRKTEDGGRRVEGGGRRAEIGPPHDFAQHGQELCGCSASEDLRYLLWEKGQQNGQIFPSDFGFLPGSSAWKARRG
jgi:hypothetical protein